ncbi:MAG: transcriptional regulator, TraR/DksA family protein [Pseudomonadota bacterium]
MEKTMNAVDVQSSYEPYMNAQQLEYFKNKLIIQKAELLEKTANQKEKLKTLKAAQSDILDQCNYLLEIEHELRNYSRNSQLLCQVDNALKRIDRGSFGYCQFTGNRIGLERLKALPFATLSVEALEDLEFQQ